MTPATRPAAPTLWRHPDFLKLWVGDTISQFGSQITALAIPLTAAVLLGASPFEIGLLGTVEMLPFLLISLPAGVWVDRMARRRVLISGDLVRAVALATIPGIWFVRQDLLGMPWLYVVAIVVGIATVFFDLKARREEALLAETFSGYEAYAARTRRFIPAVY